MLLQKTGFAEKDVLTIKLVTGEEIIAYYVDGNPESYTVVKPKLAVLINHPKNPDDVGLAFADFMVGIDDQTKVTIRLSHILAVAKARKAVANQYIAVTKDL